MEITAALLPICHQNRFTRFQNMFTSLLVDERTDGRTDRQVEKIMSSLAWQRYKIKYVITEIQQ